MLQVRRARSRRSRTPPPSYETLFNEDTQETADTVRLIEATNETGDAPFISASQIPVGPNPISGICPSCHQYQKTEIRHETSLISHIFECLIFITVGVLCIPCFMNSVNYTNHYCSKCAAYLGTYADKYVEV